MLLILFIVFFTSCYAETPTPLPCLKLSADHLCSSGEDLVMEGDVNIENQMGHLSADHAKIFGRHHSHDLELSSHVDITLHDGGNMVCGLARFNTSALTGSFSADPSTPIATYRRTTIDKSGKKIPILISSKSMGIEMLESGEELQRRVREITAHHDVRIEYDEKIVALTDNARYERIEHYSANHPTDPFPGVITLTPHNGKQCSVTFSTQNSIYAKEIRIDCVEQSILFNHPQGDLIALYDSGPMQRIEFSADDLTWNEDDDTLTMTGYVTVHQRGIGTLTTDKELQIFTTADKKEVRTIKTIGNTPIEYFDENAQVVRYLHCTGEAEVDHTTLTIHLARAENSSQVCFYDRSGKVLADEVLLYYAHDGEQLFLEKAHLEGNVRIENTASFDPLDTKPVHQYAMCDQLDYTIVDNSMELTADDGKRILYYDIINKIQMSAEGAELQRDSRTGSESMKGRGHVRFTLLASELAELLPESFTIEGEG